MLRRVVYIIYGALVLLMLSACNGLGNAAQPPSTGAYPGPGVQNPDDAVSSPPYPEPGAPVVDDWFPKPGDDDLLRGEATISKAELLTLESYPPQYVLRLEGTLPTPCHKLRVRVPAPDKENRVLIEAYSLSAPGEVCIQMLAPFEANISLANLPSGQYTIWLNGQEMGKIEVL
jgi:hypothetical protein